MRIAITGPTGFLGRALSEQAQQRGHQLIWLTRRPSSTDALPGVELVDWSEGSRAALPAHDAVINLAGETIGQRWDEEVKRKIRTSRLEGTRRLVDALSQMPDTDRPKLLVSASAVGYYGERGEETLTEASPRGNGFLAELCEEWENEAQKAQPLGVRVVLPRIGVVLAPGGGALGKFLLPFKMGVGGPLGSGRQWFPWVHRADVVGLILFALDRGSLEGPVNAVAPGIVRGTEFARRLGKALHRPALIPTPVFGLRLILGEFAEYVVESQHVIPEAATAVGFSFRFPNLPEALGDIFR